MGSKLNEQQRAQTLELLKEFEHTFSTKEHPLGLCTVSTHKIDTGNAAPVKQSLRRFSLWQIEEIDRQMIDILKLDVAVPCYNTEWVSNIVIARKRMVVRV